ncbi:MAG: DNA repair protein RadA [Spirochaetales bacterium]|nr:DNA repair protein RadA [Spirochaetales bacterium]
MAKNKSVFQCSECSHTEPKWIGRCPNCSSWNSFVEVLPEQKKLVLSGLGDEEKSRLLDDISVGEGARLETSLSEFDRVLGGGLVEESGILIGGEPGIGKSTLMLQVASLYGLNHSVLYVSGEESANQIKARANRLGISGKNLSILATSSMDLISAEISRLRPRIVIVDSVQTVLTRDAGVIPGSPNQIKFATYEVLNVASSVKASVFFTAHVTKEGVIAGPKTAEHMVDTVIYFEQADNDIRVLRAVKNRFGSIDEIGLFRMSEKGLLPIENPSALFLHRREGELPAGCAQTLVVEGSRAFAIEIQALTVSAQSSLSRTFSDKIDSKRISRIAAVLEKQLGVCFSSQDIYVKVAGGLRVNEFASDLAIAVALYSARTGVPLPSFTAFLGEVSLAGEIMPIPFLQKRLKAASESGFQTVFAAQQDNQKLAASDKIKIFPLKNIKESIAKIFNTKS